MSFARDLRLRELQRMSCDSFRSRYHVSSDFINRLGLETTLEGHTGCVNCLQWSSNGELLASGSDDVKIILWNPLVGKKKMEIHTGHKGNIFSVKFMPLTNDRLIVSGAADSQIKLHDVSRQETTQTFANHMGRVKRIEVAQDCPHLFWSASEDGTIMETDIRAPPTETTVLVNLMSVLGRSAEAKCLSINPRKPEQIAVGANDPYVRVYDRRRMKAQLIEFPPNSNGSRRLWDRKIFLSRCESAVSAPLTECAQYFVAGHLPKKEQDYKRKLRPLAATYVTFSPDGNELLVNLGGEQIYLFDMLNSKQPMLNSFQFQSFLQAGAAAAANTFDDEFDQSPEMMEGPSNGFFTASTKESPLSTPSPKSGEKKPFPELPPHIDQMKTEANSEFEHKRYSSAIALYNVAIQKCLHPILLGNRAAALLRRKWDGDVYAALRDCHDALLLDPSHAKAHLRLVRCLIDLKWLTEAESCLNLFRLRFPENSSSTAFKLIEKDLKETNKGRKPESARPERSEGNGTTSRTIFLSYSYENLDSNESDDTATNSTLGGESGGDSNPVPPPRIDSGVSVRDFDQETECRDRAIDYSARFCGHCNTTTDIKEASFFGSEGQFIVAGSDDGKFFCWEKATGNIVRVLKGDESIVNCLQSHPTSCVLATSGIDPVVRIWAPLPQDGRANEHLVCDFDKAMMANQRRMNADPFETILIDMGYRVRGNPSSSGASRAANHDDSSSEEGSVQCRTS